MVETEQKLPLDLDIRGGIMINDIFNEKAYKKLFYHENTDVYICGAINCECLCDLPNDCKICKPYYLTEEE